MEASSFYTGLVADLYGPLKGHAYGPEAYARFISASGEPALELGCGDGEPLLALRAQGFDVDGVDSSADMLEHCRAAAAGQGIDVALHHQSMESLALPRRYRSIFLAGPTFNLLPDDAAADRALVSIRQHLAPGGSALVPLHIPAPTPAAELERHRQIRTEDGAVLRVAAVRQERDEHERTQTTVMRYERSRDDGTEVVERPWVLHWHTQAGFGALVRDAGLVTRAVFDPEGGPATETADIFVFWLSAAA